MPTNITVGLLHLTLETAAFNFKPLHLYMPVASIIIAFYNDIKLLRLVLVALKNQYRDQFEVLIADDGSTPEVVAQVDEMLKAFPFPSKHFWQADEGFRKTIVMNRAVTSAVSETLIFIDGDCVPQVHFVDDHVRASKLGFCSVGRRIDCFRDAIDHLDCSQPDLIVFRNIFRLIFWSLTFRARNIEKGFRLPPRFLKKIPSQKWGVVGCNFSIQKSDLLFVNGFDERHSTQWGAEDSDVQRRLQKAGLKLNDLRYQATMIHFDASYHKRHLPTVTPEKNFPSFYDQAAAENRAWTPFGIIKEDRPDPLLDK